MKLLLSCITGGFAALIAALAILFLAWSTDPSTWGTDGRFFALVVVGASTFAGFSYVWMSYDDQD